MQAGETLMQLRQRIFGMQRRSGATAKSLLGTVVPESTLMTKLDVPRGPFWDPYCGPKPYTSIRLKTKKIPPCPNPLVRPLCGALGNLLFFGGRVRRIAPFLAISSNFDKPKCCDHLEDALRAPAPSPGTIGGLPGVPLSRPGNSRTPAGLTRETPGGTWRGCRRAQCVL